MQLKFRLDTMTKTPANIHGAQCVIDTLKFYPMDELFTDLEVTPDPVVIALANPPKDDPNKTMTRTGPNPLRAHGCGILELSFTDVPDGNGGIVPRPDLSAFVKGKIYTVTIDAGE